MDEAERGQKEKELREIHECRVLWMASCGGCHIVFSEVPELAKFQTPADLLARPPNEDEIIGWCRICQKASVFTRV